MKLLKQNKKSKTIFQLLLIALCFILFSSPQILTPINRIEITPVIDSSLAEVMSSGSFFVIPSKENEGFQIRIGKDILTFSKNHKHLIGAIALNPHSWTSLWGWRNRPSGADPTTFQWFQKWVKVDKPPLNLANPLRLPAAVIQKLDSADEDKKRSEREKMKKALISNSPALDTNCFQLPIHSKIVSKFASPRTLPSGISYHHTGVDLRAGIGTRINAAASGKVVLAEEMTLPGNSVVLDHGGGLFTAYKHLSRIDVKLGDLVSKGKLIGLAGATGRVEAPHLHWEAFWKGSPANPLQLLQVSEPICDQL